MKVMKSPFPGMDPYLEAHWLDVHAALIMYARDQIQPQLGQGLRARVEERLVLESPFNGHNVYPDVRIVETAPTRKTFVPTSGLAVAEPLMTMTRQVGRRTETFLKVIDAGGGDVVTTVEFLSLTNKTPGPGMEEYLQKQRELAEADVNLVEIDLLRAGKRAFHDSRFDINKSLRTYQAYITRAWGKGEYTMYGFSLMERLPALPIPLRKGDPDVFLDLQRLIDMAYENGAYDDIDYRQPAKPPLEGEVAVWANGVLKEKGMR